MSEIEVPVEAAQEEIHKHAEHAGSHDPWIGRVALASAILAALAAIAALLAGHHGNEAMLDQIQASNSWSYYEAKSIKSSILQSRSSLLVTLGKPSDSADAKKLEEYQHELEQISERAKEKEHTSTEHLHVHEILARAVTLFQIAITLAAISVLTRRKRFWYVSLAFGLLGVVSLSHGLLTRVG